MDIELKTFPKENAGTAKKLIVETLHGGVCCVGNGYNDIAPEDALNLLLNTDRLRATLRN